MLICFWQQLFILNGLMVKVFYHFDFLTIKELRGIKVFSLGFYLYFLFAGLLLWVAFLRTVFDRRV